MPRLKPHRYYHVLNNHSIYACLVPHWCQIGIAHTCHITQFTRFHYSVSPEHKPIPTRYTTNPLVDCSCYTNRTMISHSVKRIYYSFNIIESHKLQTTCTVVIHALFTNLTSLCRICWRVCSTNVAHDQLLWVRGDGCHMWDRKYSLFPEHMNKLTLGSSWYHPFIVYVHHRICQYYVYVYV